MLSRRTVPLVLLLAALGCSSSNSSSAPAIDTSELCTTPLAPNEPLCSTAFGDTVWAGSHRASYAQGSSALPGPADSQTSKSEHLVLEGAGIPVIASFSRPYEDGGRAVWSTILGADSAIVKIDHETLFHCRPHQLRLVLRRQRGRRSFVQHRAQEANLLAPRGIL
jgi:hypothetical protein